jgi:hypothetical protein
MRAWGAVSGDFERRLAGQEGGAVTGAHIESETRRGKDSVRVTIAMTVSAPDVAQALVTAWRAFRKAAGDDTAGWDMASASAEVRPEAPLSGLVARQQAGGDQGHEDPDQYAGGRPPQPQPHPSARREAGLALVASARHRGRSGEITMTSSSSSPGLPVP